MPRDAVLDASAVLALVQDEPGSGRVALCIPGALISAVNFAEVVGKLADAGMPGDQIELALSARAPWNTAIALAGRSWTPWG